MPTKVDSTVVNKMVDLILTKAIEAGAPSIRIDATEKNTRVNFEIGDILRLESVPPIKYHAGIIARLRSMAKVSAKGHEGVLKVRFEKKDYQITATFPPEGEEGTTVLRFKA